MPKQPDDFRAENAGDESLVRLIRAATPRGPAGPKQPNREALEAYLSGAASEAQKAEVRAALMRNDSLRREVVEIQEACDRLETPAARDAFLRARVPPIEEFPRLVELRRDLVPARSRATTRQRWGWPQWVVGGWAVAATAACAMLVLSPRLSPRSPSLDGGYALEAPGGLVNLSRSRGAGDEPEPVVLVAPGTRALLLRIPPPESDSLVNVTLIGPDGKTLLTESRMIDEFTSGGPLVLRSGTTPFAGGRYQLVVRGSHESNEFAFVVQTPKP